MASIEHVTVALPDDLVRDIDRREPDRSKFVEEAIRHEFDRPRRHVSTVGPGEGWIVRPLG